MKPNDPTLYDRHADRWWVEGAGPFRSLQRVNRYRLAVVRRWFGGRIAGARVLDLGCGGGLLSVPLRDDGARLLGIDRSLPSLAAARRQEAFATWVAGDAKSLPLADASVDLVLCSDVLEHVPGPARVLAEVARVLRPDGLAYVSTLNRTLRARLLAVTLAERIGLVPRGTHDPRLFLRPDELRAACADAGLRVERLAGEGTRLGATVRDWAIAPRPSRSLAVSYSALLARETRP